MISTSHGLVVMPIRCHRMCLWRGPRTPRTGAPSTTRVIPMHGWRGGMRWTWWPGSLSVVGSQSPWTMRPSVVVLRWRPSSVIVVLVLTCVEGRSVGRITCWRRCKRCMETMYHHSSTGQDRRAFTLSPPPPRLLLIIYPSR